MAKQDEDTPIEEEAEAPSTMNERNVLLASIAMGLGTKLLKGIVNRHILSTDAPAPAPSTTPMADKAVTVAASTIAAKSVPGAALIGSGLLAKSLYRRGKARRLARKYAAKRAALSREEHASEA